MAVENNDGAAIQCALQPTPEAQSHFQFPGARTSPGPLQGQRRLIKSQPVGDTQRFCINNHSFIFQEGSHLQRWRPFTIWLVYNVSGHRTFRGDCRFSVLSATCTWHILPLWFPVEDVTTVTFLFLNSLYLKHTVSLLSQPERSSLHQAPFWPPIQLTPDAAVLLATPLKHK